MSETEEETETPPKKASKMPLILGLVMALTGAGGGFYATWSGMILGDDAHHDAAEATPKASSADVAYVAIDPLVISLRPPSQNQHLKFRAQLETTPDSQAEVEKLLPRVMDVLNSYLRALEVADIEDPSALTRLRAQMLRRVQVVTGAGHVNDLLIMEFVLN
ncbi:flagellar basal body-associated FliL family protein [Sulfitobacter sp. PR48]|uniref:flagellar basal body-associated FliL family protein n=1 Tax=Sulfitobacter sp. PR48 TaxID=3028383 RepID=UPI00237B841E|nr:flagellar basal body-associated FliL family protein [Sulfitobacter sp. PR48]MDD9719427.1 flagellar basal body-associated FliL family protein [Sulfitobacter sp. PR48]